MYLGGSPHQLPGIFTLLPYGELAGGLWLPQGGIYGLVRAVEKLARELGVRIETGRRVRRIRVRDGRVAALEFDDASDLVCPLAVSNVDAPLTQRGLLSDPPRSFRAPRMTPAVCTFYWGIRGRVEGAGHHMIFLPADARCAYRQLIRTGEIPEELPFYVSVASETDPSLAPPGDAAVFVLIPLPLSVMSHRGDRMSLASELRGRVIERLRRHGIRLEPSAIAVERVLLPRDWAARCGLFQGSAFGAAHTLFQMGSFRQPNRDPNVRGLYYVGASTVPGTGLPMVTLGGRLTAERIASDVR
jgi:phytoene desaturase